MHAARMLHSPSWPMAIQRDAVRGRAESNGGTEGGRSPDAIAARGASVQAAAHRAYCAPASGACWAEARHALQEQEGGKGVWVGGEGGRP